MTEPAREPLEGLPNQIRRNPRAIVSAGLAALVLFGYPLAFEKGVAWIGVRGVAGLALGFSLASVLWSRHRAGIFPGIGVSARLALFGLFSVAAVTGDPFALRLIGPVVFWALASVFWRSLRDGGSVIETLVRNIEPATPGFVRPYCRKLTALWSAFFLANALILAVLVVRGPLETWAFYSGRVVYAEMGVIFVVDFFVRKTWFRYYFGSGPFDRLWSFLFPAENTAAGRRSAAYIRQVKGQ